MDEDQKKIRIPWIPILGALFIAFFYWIEPDVLADKGTVPDCDSFASSKSCTGASALADNTPPKVTGMYPVDNSFDIGPDATATFSVCDYESGINVNSLQGSIYLPSIEYYPYDIEDKENLTASPSTAGCYQVDLTHEEEIPRGNSARWWITACDCAGNRSEAEIFAANEDMLIWYLWEIGYILQFVIWYFAIFGPQLFPRSWGIVYDSEKKHPVPRAVVRLYSKDGALVESIVTDMNGIFVFKPEPGTYFIQAQAGGYTFPSKMAPQTVDGRRKNLYYGEEFDVSTSGEPLRICIPLDPLDTSPPSFAQRLSSSAMSTVNSMNTWLLFAIGVFMPLVWLEPPWVAHTLIYTGVNLALLILQVVFERRARGRIGTVKDDQGKPVEGLELGLYDRTYDKLIDIKKTDKRGRFQFVVPGGKYYIAPTGPEYVLIQTEGKKGIEVGESTDENILIAPDIKVRRTK